MVKRVLTCLKKVAVCNVKFYNYYKQLQALLVIYTGFECNLNNVQKPNRDNADASYRFSQPVQIYQCKNSVYRFIEKML